MSVSYKWRPITDLEADPATLTDGELDSLQRVWASQKIDLADRGVLDEFLRQIGREWSIETGIIENVYTLDRGVTRTLIEKGIDASLIPHDATNRDNVLVARIIQDHYDALEGMFEFVKGERPLSTSYIKELHAALLRNQETYGAVDQFGHAFEKRLEKGQFKVDPNSPTRPDGTIHEYCPPEHVASEMDRLIALHAEHASKGIPPEVEAAWLHHRFAQIHPFADGNGRVARAISSLVFIKAGLFPLIVKREDWTSYIDALEKADAGDLRPLVSILVEGQRNAIIQATEVAFEVNPPASTEQAIAAVRDRLVQRGKLPFKEWLITKQTAAQLSELASHRFAALTNQMVGEISQGGKGFKFQAGTSQARSYTDSIQALATKAGHLANPLEFNQQVQLSLDAGKPNHLVVSFHAIGPKFRGLIGAIAYFHVDGGGPSLLDGGSFLINYDEQPDKAKARFTPWLERMIVEGLNEWRRTL